MLAAVKEFLLGDPSEASLLPPVQTYDEIHNSCQGILLPPVYPKGLSCHLLQPLTRRFALQHKASLTPGEMKETPFGPMPGQGTRAYSLGGVMAHELEGGGKWRLSGQMDPGNLTARGVVLGDVWGTGRLRVLLQAALEPAPPEEGAGSGRGSRASAAGGGWSGEWGATATLRSDAYTAVARAKNGVEVGGSLSGRLAPGSPITVGGEAMVSLSELSVWSPQRARGGGGAVPQKSRAVEFALGCAYDTQDSKTSLNLATTKSFSSSVVSLQHVVNVTERSHLASKIITDMALSQSMVAVGYKMRFRNTLTTLHGMVDSYGSVRQVRGGAFFLFTPPPPHTYTPLRARALSLLFHLPFSASLFSLSLLAYARTPKHATNPSGLGD
jgi:hypothetical protein